MMPDINAFIPNPDLEENLEQAKKLLAEVPEFSKTIDYLMDNPEVSTWVETGVELNKGKKNCEFCQNPIGKNRETELLAHFSEDLKKHKRDLAVLKARVNESMLEHIETQKSDFYKDLWEDFNQVSAVVKDAINNYNQDINKLVSLIQSKIDLPFKSISDFSTIKTSSSELEAVTLAYNQIIESHNKKH
jgi:wobble nucleotide-excising tRNase